MGPDCRHESRRRMVSEVAAVYSRIVTHERETGTSASVAAVDAASTAHLGQQRVTLGWAIFALTAAAVAAGIALDLHVGAYTTLVYHFVGVALALIAVLLTARWASIQRRDHR